MAGVRAIQKEKTRRALIDAAFNQLSAEKSFSNLSLREVAREAGMAHHPMDDGRIRKSLLTALYLLWQ